MDHGRVRARANLDKPWLPAMHVWNIFENVLGEFVGFFDIVHVRLITVVVKNNDPRPIPANLNKLLSMYLL